MTTMKWQTAIPTREQINAHRANGGVWLVLAPTTSPFGGARVWPSASLATFTDEDDGVVMYAISMPKRRAPEQMLGARQEANDGDLRGAWHFAPVVMDDGDYTFQPAGAPSGVTVGDGHGYDANTGITHGTGEEG